MSFRKTITGINKFTFLPIFDWKKFHTPFPLMSITSVNVISQISMNGNKIDNTINEYMKSTNDSLLITMNGKNDNPVA